MMKSWNSGIPTGCVFGEGILWLKGTMTSIALGIMSRGLIDLDGTDDR